MYIFPNKAEVTQISLTGARLIVLLGALMTAPRDLTEMNNLLTECGLVDKNYSSDTIRIALSTLKAIGCKISRPCKSNNFKYALIEHPFALTLDQEEIQSLKTVYTNLTKESTYKTALAFNKFFKTLSKHICSEETLSELNDITGFYKINEKVLDKLTLQIGKHNTINLSYLSPTNKLKKHSIVFGDLFLKNNKLYVQGTNNETNTPITLSVTRITEIHNVIETENTYKSKACNVTFSLKNYEHYKMPEKHEILDVKNNTATVNAEFSNSFFAIQHILTLGSDCTVIAPQEIKAAIITKLTELRKIYE